MNSEQRESIEVVSMDRGNAYFASVKEHIPHAAVCFDPFHIAKNVNDAVGEVRKKEANKNEQDKSVIKGKRYLLLKGKERLTDEQQTSLNELLALNKNINIAYLLKEQLRNIYAAANNKEEGKKGFMEWFQLVGESLLLPFMRISKTFMRNLPEILNYFEHRLTSGRIEGLNSRIARIQHKCRGVSTIRYLFLRLRLLTSPAFAPLRL